MDGCVAWWYIFVFGLPVLALLMAGGFGYWGYARNGGSYKYAALFALGILLLFAVLFLFVPWNLVFGDGKREVAHGKRIAKGNWVDVYEHPTDPTMVVKQWYTVGDRRSVWNKMTDRDLFKNKRARTGIDYYGWAACMILQWSSVREMERYQGEVTGVPRTREVSPDTLSWAQERAVTPGPDHPVGDDMRQTNAELKERGLHFIDVHSKNVMVNPDTGRVVYTDGELCRGTQLAISKWVYRAMGNEFVPVGDCDRILWADEEEGRDRGRTPPFRSKNHRGVWKEGAYAD